MVMTFGQEPDAARRIRQAQGTLIRKARKSRGISVEEFAEVLGVTVGAVSQWENGRHSPRPHHQVAIAKALGMPWSFIFGLDDAA